MSERLLSLNRAALQNLDFCSWTSGRFGSEITLPRRAIDGELAP
jgi:hypothetical protein